MDLHLASQPSFHLSMKDGGKAEGISGTLISCQPQGLSLAIRAGDGAAQGDSPAHCSKAALRRQLLQKGSIGVSHTICSTDNYNQIRSEARSIAGQVYKPV